MFHSAGKTVAEAAADGSLLKFGIKTTCPYIYIVCGDLLGSREGYSSLGSFVEKPQRPAAEGCVKNS